MLWVKYGWNWLIFLDNFKNILKCNTLFTISPNYFLPSEKKHVPSFEQTWKPFPRNCFIRRYICRFKLTLWFWRKSLQPQTTNTFLKETNFSLWLSRAKNWKFNWWEQFYKFCNMFLGYNARIFVPLWKKPTNCYVALRLSFLITWDKVSVMLSSSHEIYSFFFHRKPKTRGQWVILFT